MDKITEIKLILDNVGVNTLLFLLNEDPKRLIIVLSIL